MKQLKILIMSGICFAGFSQNESINQLKQTQDLRKKYIDTGRKYSTKAKSSYVNPFIGTGGHGHTFPGATAPFGMMQLSPDTRYEGWDGCSGYHYSDSIIYGFSHTHLSGTGVPDYGDLLIVPQVGNAKITPGYKDPNGYGHRFSHQQEKAAPGYYEVTFPDEKIGVRLTTSERAGIHEYSFNEAKGKRFILIDLDHRDKLLDYKLKVIDKQTISGYRTSAAWANEQHFYFYLQTSIPFKNSTLITENGQHKLLLTFDEAEPKILVKVGMSAVDEKGARQNLETEIPEWNFDAVRSATAHKWEAELNKIAIETNDQAVLSNFYTALYHTCIQPNIFSDVDGRYRGRDNNIHSIEDSMKQYTVFSLWDTYRAANPLYTLIQPERTNEFIHTFLRQYEQGGDLPVWELAGNETECMIGYHSVSVIADAYAKGIRGFDAEKALKAMMFTSQIDELGKKQFHEKGFINSGDEPESVSKTLEYAYNDFCISTMAKAMGKSDFSNQYAKSSMNFVNLFDPNTKFMRARRDGLWYTPFDPSEVNFNYTEANSWQYSLYAPHAVDVLSSRLGGKDSLEHWLDRLLTTKTQLSGRDQADITGLIGQYAHGNEPSHHMIYLYNYTNAGYKTGKYVDKILSDLYSPTPDGLSGNEDCGQMSAWYVLSALGFYQVTPGHPWYDFGRPLINKATIRLGNGKTLKLNVLNNSPQNCYIQSIKMNGQAWNSNGFYHSSIADGGEIQIEMGPQPNSEKRSPSNSVFSNETAQLSRFTPVPFFIADNRIFDTEMELKIGTQQPINGEKIDVEYRFINDTTNIYSYSEPLKITQTTELEARQIATYKPGANSMPQADIYKSQWVRARFIKRDNSLQLKLGSSYANQYTAAGPNTLIDGVRGTNEFRTGDWQGYYVQDIIAELTLEKPRVLSEVGISCLQDMKSWIFYPSDIQIEISMDGEHFISLKDSISIPQYSNYSGPAKAEFLKKTGSTKPIKKVRIIAKNFGKCPDWHLGAGNDTWLFADEIILK